MKNRLILSTISLMWLLLSPLKAEASQGLEIFAKGSVSKNHIERDSYTVSVSATAGMAIVIIPRIRVEGRYTNISSLQNKLAVGSPVSVGTINDMKTQTAIYSLGIDIDILGDKAAVQPFIFIGGGYITTERSYYFTPTSGTAVFYSEPRRTGFSGNAGAGFKVRIARSVAFEIEVFGYGMDIDQPDPLINLYGTVGIRLFI